MIFSAIILLTCAVNLGSSVTLELYSEQKYSGLLKTITVNQTDEGKCIKFDQTYEVRSLKTDKCVMIYETDECSHIDASAPKVGSKMYSVRVERNTAQFDIDAAYSNRKEERGVKSFHVCSSDLGGGLKLNVDIYDGPTYTGDLVASYRDVCECKNIPSYIILKGKYFSIDNHGNSMHFYDKADCTGQERLIPAGDNERSRSVFSLDAHAAVIRSFRPVGAFSCLSLDASVYKFTFFNGSDMSGKTENVQYKVNYGQNTGDTDKKEDFYTNSPISMEHSVAKAFTDIRTSRLKQPEFEISFEDGLADLFGGIRDALRRDLEAQYQFTDTHRNTATIFTVPKEAHLSVDLASRSMCSVHFSVSTVKGFPISYTVESTVAGFLGNEKLSAEQIRHFLPPGMKYVKDNDDYSVVVTAEGEMKASFPNYSYGSNCFNPQILSQLLGGNDKKSAMFWPVYTR